MWAAIYQGVLQEVEWRKYHYQKSFNDCQVISCFIFLIYRDGGKLFDALQEKASQDAYGNLLGRLVCFYVRLLSLQEPDESLAWLEEHPWKPSQVDKVHQLMNILDTEIDAIVLDDIFHKVIKELFCWTESKRLREEIECPVQRFLMVACLRHEGNGFIHVQDITPLIAKLCKGTSPNLTALF